MMTLKPVNHLPITVSEFVTYQKAGRLLLPDRLPVPLVAHLRRP